MIERNALVQAYGIPTDATVVEHAELNAVVYLYNYASGKPCAVAFQGRRTKPDFRFSFPTVERRESCVADWLKGIRAKIQYKNDQRQAQKERDAQPVSLKVGDILHYSWGYEQTNCEFYQIVSIKGRKAVIERILSETVEVLGSMSSNVKPVPNSGTGKIQTVRIKSFVGGEDYVSMKHGLATLTDGKRSHYSSCYA